MIAMKHIMAANDLTLLDYKKLPETFKSANPHVFLVRTVEPNLPAAQSTFMEAGFADIETHGRPMVIQRLTVKIIRDYMMNPYQVVEWLLQSDFHLITFHIHQCFISADSLKTNVSHHFFWVCCQQIIRSGYASDQCFCRSQWIIKLP
jgi:hypothetical protein